MLDESTFRQSSLCVVGNINRDVKTTPLRPDESLFRDGETSVSGIAETIGGGGANSAFAAATLGASVAFLGKVGADGLGQRLERTLTKHGIWPLTKRTPAAHRSHWPSPTANVISSVACQPAGHWLFQTWT